MRLEVLFVVAVASCKPPVAPSPGATCVAKSWYPGVTAEHAARSTLVFDYTDESPKTWAPEDICLMIDDQAMLTNAHRNIVVPRLGDRETLTWRGTVAPGKHTIALYLRTKTSSGAYDLASSHAFDVTGAMTVEARIAEAKEPEPHAIARWFEAQGARMEIVKAPPPDAPPVVSSSPPPYMPPTWYTPP